VPDDLLDLFLSATEDYGIILLDADGRCVRATEGTRQEHVDPDRRAAWSHFKKARKT
jgi:hypothetical protein